MLAEAFCTSDERVRRVQAELDDAQATRTRTLAAFAVTVGNDGSIADVMGLNEREVRLARRTVGKEDARALAAELLRKAVEPPATQPEEPSVTAEGAWMPGPRREQPPQDTSATQPPPDATPPAAATPGAPPPSGSSAPGCSAGHAPAGTPTADTASPDAAAPYAQTPPSAAGPAPAPAAAAAATPAKEEPVAWSPAMDSVLLWSWHSGIDLQAVAAELDLDVRALLQRVQALAAEGLLVLKPSHGDSVQAGRHRRHDDFFVSAPDSPEALYTHVGYVTQPY